MPSLLMIFFAVTPLSTNAMIWRPAAWAERSLSLQTEPKPRAIVTVEGLYRGAYSQGRESGQAVVVAQAGHWLRSHGIEPPKPDPQADLAPGAGGG